MQRIIGIIASALISLLTLPVAAGAAEHHPASDRSAVRDEAAPRAAARPVVREEAAPRQVERIQRPAVREEIAPRPVERPVVRQEVVPRPVERPIVREEEMPRPVVHEYAPRPVAHREVIAPRAVERPIVREQRPREIREAPRAVFREMHPRMQVRPIVHERFVEPRRAPFEQRFAPRRAFAPERIERRNRFVRYYTRNYFAAAPRRVVFRRFVPQRIFVAPPVQIVRTYVARPTFVRTAWLPVYSGYMPIYGSSPAIGPVFFNAPVQQLPLPIAWSPVQYGSFNDNDADDNGGYYGYNGYNGYNGYPYNGQYASYPQYPYTSQYPNQYGYGFNAPFGANPFGNAQLQGIVISNTNGGILVLTPNLQPVFVNTSIAQQNGYVNGNISPGSFVNVFGYNTGNEFIATALG